MNPIDYQLERAWAVAGTPNLVREVVGSSCDESAPAPAAGELSRV